MNPQLQPQLAMARARRTLVIRAGSRIRRRVPFTESRPCDAPGGWTGPAPTAVVILPPCEPLRESAAELIAHRLAERGVRVILTHLPMLRSRERQAAMTAVVARWARRAPDGRVHVIGGSEATRLSNLPGPLDRYVRRAVDLDETPEAIIELLTPRQRWHAIPLASAQGVEVHRALPSDHSAGWARLRPRPPSQPESHAGPPAPTVEKRPPTAPIRHRRARAGWRTSASQPPA